MSPKNLNAIKIPKNLVSKLSNKRIKILFKLFESNFEIKERLSSWDDISFKPARRYISIKKGKKVKIYLNFQSNRIKIHMFRRVDFKGQIERQKVKFNLDDPKKLFHMKSDNRREIYEYFMKDKENFDYLLSLFRQKYDA